MLLYLVASLPSVSLDPRQSRFGGALAQQLRALLSLVRSASVVWRLPPAGDERNDVEKDGADQTDDV